MAKENTKDDEPKPKKAKADMPAQAAIQAFNLAENTGSIAQLFEWLYGKAKNTAENTEAFGAKPEKIQPTPPISNPLQTAASTENTAENKDRPSLQQEQKQDKTKGTSLDI